MPGRVGPTKGTYNTIFVRITVSIAYDANDQAQEFFWSVNPEKVPLSMGPTPQRPDDVVFMLDTPLNVVTGLPIHDPGMFGWDDDNVSGAITMDAGWHGQWGTPERIRSNDKNYPPDYHNLYRLRLVGLGPVVNHPYPYTIKLRYRGTPIPPLDPEIELGSM